jgi:hypothetical protein
MVHNFVPRGLLFNCGTQKVTYLAAYATYTRRDEFRKFAMRAWVLEPYVQAFTDRGKWQVRSSFVLAYIRDPASRNGVGVEAYHSIPLLEGRHIHETAHSSRMYSDVSVPPKN